MDQGTLLNQFQNIRQASISGNRAPHKPLLLLYILSRLWMEKSNCEISYADIKPKLTELLNRFYGSKKKQNTKDPFLRLLADQIGWELKGIDSTDHSHIHALKERDLVSNGVTCGFNRETEKILLEQPNLILRLAHLLLTRNFPESYFSVICQELGLPFPLKEFIDPDLVDSRCREDRESQTTKRDPNFREKVLNAYRRRCAFCGSAIRLRDTLVDLEAAHIRWHCYDGPDTVPNGLALCSSHHKLFDWGAISLKRNSASYRIILAVTLNSTGPIESWLERMRGTDMLLPRDRQDWPNPEFVDWHLEQVFEKSP